MRTRRGEEDVIAYYVSDADNKFGLTPQWQHPPLPSVFVVWSDGGILRFDLEGSTAIKRQLHICFEIELVCLHSLVAPFVLFLQAITCLNAITSNYFTCSYVHKFSYWWYDFHWQRFSILTRKYYRESELNGWIDRYEGWTKCNDNSSIFLTWLYSQGYNIYVPSLQ